MKSNLLSGVAGAGQRTVRVEGRVFGESRIFSSGKCPVVELKLCLQNRILTGINLVAARPILRGHPSRPQCGRSFAIP